MLAEKLGFPGLTYARKLEVADRRVRVQRETETGYMTLSAALPAVVSVTKSANEPRYPSLKGIMGAKKDIKQLAAADLGPTVAVGTAGSKAQLTDFATPPARAKGQVLQAPDPAEGAKAIVQFLKDWKFLRKTSSRSSSTSTARFGVRRSKRRRRRARSRTSRPARPMPSSPVTVRRKRPRR